MSPASVFLDAVRRSPGLWQSIDFRVVAIRVGAAWHNMFTRVVLRSELPNEVPRLTSQVHTSRIRAEQHVLPFTMLEPIIEGVSSGAWPEENPVCYLLGAVAQSSQSPGPYAFHHTSLYSLDPSYVNPDHRWTTHTLSANGDSVSALLGHLPSNQDELRAIVRNQPRAFKSFDSMASHVLGSGRDRVSQGAATCEILAPYPIRIVEDQIHLRDGTLTIGMEASGAEAIDRARLRMIVRRGREEVVEPVQIPAPSLWTQSIDGRSCWTGQLAVGAASEVSLALNLGEQDLQWVEREAFLTDGISVPLAMYQSLDPGLDILAEALTAPEKAKQQRQHIFEEAVARLFTLAGFQVDAIRSKRLSDEVDFLAYAPDHRICLACECTTDAINSNGKLGKFVARVSQLQEIAGRFEVRPMIATSLLSAGIAQPDLQSARQAGIQVLSREVLLAMRTQILRGGGIKAILDVLRASG